MDYKEFEERLSGQFKEHKPSGLDSEAMWAEVEAVLPDRKKRRFFWVFLAGLMLMMTAAFFLMNSDNGEVLLSDLQQEVMGTEVVSPQVASTISQEVVVAESKATDVSDLDEEVMRNEDMTMDRKLPKASARINRNQVNSRHETAASLQPKVVSDRKSTTMPKTVIDQDFSKGETTLNKKQVSLVTKENQEDPVILNTEDAALDKVDLVLEETNDTVEMETETTLHDQNLESTSLEVSEAQPKSMEAEKNEKRKSSFKLGVVSGYYKPAAIYDKGRLSDLRRNQETELEAFDASVMIRYALNEKWSIASGITYSRVNQSSINTNTFLRMEQSDEVVVGRVIAISGSYDILDDGILTTEVRQTYQRYISYESIALPVELQYRAISGDRWGLQLSAGLEYSIKGMASGYEQNAGETEYDLTSDVDTRLKDKSSHYLLFGVHAAYDISESVSWQFGLQAKQAMTGLYNDNILFKKQFLLPGLRTGVFINL